MYRNNRIAVVVPAYNEELLIQDTLRGIPDFVDRVYVVNDGSTDDTAERISEIASNDPRIILIDHEVNKGVGAAIVTGYMCSLRDAMDITAVMAGDNQMDPLQLHRLLDPIVEGNADYTKGHRLRSRATANGMSRWRCFGNNMLTYLTRIAAGNNRINDPQNGYTAISNRVFQIMKPETIFTWYGYCNDMLVKLSAFGFKIIDVDIPARYGRERSGISYPKYMVRISRLLFNELVWRLNQQQLTESPRMADGAMMIGSVLPIAGLAIAATSYKISSNNALVVESYAAIIITLALTGIMMLYMGYAIKNGGNFKIGSRKA